MQNYRVPRIQMIARDERTERLYKLEDARAFAIRDAAQEWSALVAEGVIRPIGMTLGRYPDLYNDALPQQLLDTLESYDVNAALLAALAFIQHYEMSNPDLVAAARTHLQEEENR